MPRPTKSTAETAQTKKRTAFATGDLDEELPAEPVRTKSPAKAKGPAVIPPSRAATSLVEKLAGKVLLDRNPPTPEKKVYLLRKKIFSSPLKDLPNLRGATVAVLYLVSVKFVSAEMIAAELGGQLSRTSVFAVLADHVASGYLTFETLQSSVGAPSRVFALTPLGEQHIQAYINFCDATT